MKKLTRIFSLYIFLFFLNFFSLNAQIPLKTYKINQYISTISQLDTMMTEYKNDNPDEKNEEETTSLILNSASLTPITDGLMEAKTHPTYAKFNDIITEADFSSAGEWASTGDMIMTSYSAYHLKKAIDEGRASLEEMKKEMIADRDNITKNQFISLKQKELLLNKIQNSVALISDPNYIDNENLSIISPYIERLDSLFKEYQ